MRFLIPALLLFAAFSADAAGFGPWRFGMSAEEIRAVESNGPYREFSNGDLETYNADFGGTRQNAQFYLKEGHLWRVALRVYEGTDLSKATRVWAQTHTTLKTLHGPLETPDLSGETLEALAASAEAVVAHGGKAQMAPVSQPVGTFVFSSFNALTHEGVTYYMVTVNYDQASP
ncbi:hypothetical protein [Xanthomonas sp. NCPPB 1128]|uniref:hypothetical protein n=1 Tax=Xanthomonas sp. NCPPB 1128 TaxID=1775876 RepID=UPI000A65C832|nr:hypothetical protein [Xanthomonas sp. NCPPB 1128]